MGLHVPQCLGMAIDCHYFPSMGCLLTKNAAMQPWLGPWEHLSDSSCHCTGGDEWLEGLLLDVGSGANSTSLVELHPLVHLEEQQAAI